jgi:hypothetical protein
VITANYPRFPDDHCGQYGALDTYQIAAEWLDGHGTVTDWGCGKEFAKRFFKKSQYMGIDGTFGENLVDLATVRISCDSILMRHILENNPEGWRDILENALASFHRRMVVVTFTHFVNDTYIYKTEEYPTGPLSYLRFRKDDLTNIMGNLLVDERAVKTTHPEHVFFLEK